MALFRCCVHCSVANNESLYIVRRHERRKRPRGRERVAFNRLLCQREIQIKSATRAIHTTLSTECCLLYAKWCIRQTNSNAVPAPAVYLFAPINMVQSESCYSSLKWMGGCAMDCWKCTAYKHWTNLTNKANLEISKVTENRYIFFSFILMHIILLCDDAATNHSYTKKWGKSLHNLMNIILRFVNRYDGVMETSNNLCWMQMQTQPERRNFSFVRTQTASIETYHDHSGALLPGEKLSKHILRTAYTRSMFSSGRKITPQHKGNAKLYFSFFYFLCTN